MTNCFAKQMPQCIFDGIEEGKKKGESLKKPINSSD
tara:strand:- start:2142 stop:2249 length:108 start_codon:yes stop_codon:yes gene_type:complete